MPEDSPPPFIVFRTPRATQAPTVTPEPYEQGLSVVAAVHELLAKADARFYVKDRLDRAATHLVFELARAAKAPPSRRWGSYRTAHDHAAVVATVLDILRAQRAVPDDEIARAQGLVRELIAALAPLTNG